jgi:ribosomal protein S14
MATQSVPACQRCGRPARYQGPHQGNLGALCSRHFALCRPTLRRATTTAVVVGTLLTALNQGDLLLAGDTTSAMLWKVPLTYVVPFLVTIWGALTHTD